MWTVLTPGCPGHLYPVKPLTSTDQSLSFCCRANEPLAVRITSGLPAICSRNEFIEMRSGAGDPGWKLIVIVGGTGTWAGPLTDASKASPHHAEAKVKTQRIPKTVKPRFFDDHRSVSLAQTMGSTARKDPLATLSLGISSATPYLWLKSHRAHRALQCPMISPIRRPAKPQIRSGPG